jgi:hypothetical protein
MGAEAEGSAMGAGFGGAKVFNPASPSSSERSVAAIVRDYVEPFAGKPPRILDVGGTQHGFSAQARLPTGTEVVIVNPERGAGARYADLREIPGSDPGYDFAMLFGVMMYVDAETLRGMFAQIRARLRGTATLLVADPDYGTPFGLAEIPLQKMRAMIFGHSFTFHTEADAEAMLFKAGFPTLRARPDLRPTYPGLPIARIPPYFIIAASI